MTTPTVASVSEFGSELEQMAWNEVTDHAEKITHDRKAARKLAFGQWLFYTGRLNEFLTSEMMR